MSKINAIYSSLDSGNARAALKLCQQVLAKSPQPLVKALMALSLSRLDNSSEALETCSSILEEFPEDKLDSGVLETIAYVFRREDRYDLLSKMLLKATAVPGAQESILREAFVAAVQSGDAKGSNLSAIAMKLFKITGDKKFYAWSAFAISLNENPNPSLAAAMLDKGLSGGPQLDASGESRTSTSGRYNAYLNLFKTQLLQNTPDACTVVDSISSTLVPFNEKEILKQDLLTNSLSFPLDALDEIIMEDSKLSDSECKKIYWRSDENYKKFLSLFRNRITSNQSRSDLTVSLAPYLSLVRADRESLDPLISQVEQLPLLNFNRYKLLYGLDKSRLNVAEITDISSELSFTENCLDECSPGKQTLLLASLLLLESGLTNFSPISQSIPGLSLLAVGSEKFPHCSHFRLLQCIAYMHLGLTVRAVERFEALGVKNSQWRNLWWLVHPGIVSSVCSQKSDLLEYSSDFFVRHKSDLLQNLETLINENLFFKYPDFQQELNSCENSGVKQFIDLELEFEKILAGTPSDKLSRTSIDVKGIRGEADYSPLLFISIPSLESTSTAEFAKKLQEKREPKARACGFRWECQTKREPKINEIPLSEDSVIGKWIRPINEESENFQYHRSRVLHAVNCLLRSEYASALTLTSCEDCHGPYKPCNELVKLVCQSKLHNPMRETDLPDAEARLKLLLSSFKDVDTNEKVFGNAKLLAGAIPAIVSVIENVPTSFSKKSIERKFFKKALHELKELVDEISENVACKEISLSCESTGITPCFLEQLKEDVEKERQLVLSVVKTLRDRIREVKL